MITQAIERAVVKGHAKSETHIHAYGAVSKIIVPANKFIIITDIKLFPFSAIADISQIPSAQTLDNLSTIQLSLFARNKKPNRFTVRNNFQIFTDGLDGFYIKNSETVAFDTYLYYDTDVYLSHLILPGINGGGGYNFQPLVNTQLPNPPASYGNSEDVLTDFTDMTGAKYYPCGIDEAGASPGANDVSQPNTLADTGSLLPEPNGIYNNNTPLVWMQYFMFNEQGRNELA